MSLYGITVAITSSRRASELANIVRKFGGVPYVAPTIGIKNSDLLISQCHKFVETVLNEKIHFFIFMTGVGVFNFFKILKDSDQINNMLEKLQDTIIIARSKKPLMELRKFGIVTHFVPNKNTVEGILELIKKFDIKNKNIGIIWHGEYTNLFKRQLESLGSKVFEFAIYSYSVNLEEKSAKILKEMGYDYVVPTEKKIKKLLEDIMNGSIDTITFTSPPAVNEFFQFARKNANMEPLKNILNHNVIVVSVGPSTSGRLEHYEINVDVMPSMYKMGPMIKKLVDFISSYD